MHVRKRKSPRWDAALCGVIYGTILFAYVTKRPPDLYGLMRPVTLYSGQIVSYFAFGAKAVLYSTTRSAIYTHKKN